jgi:hypothetical protein
MRIGFKPVLCCFPLFLSGCERSPTMNLLGSFFPSWMLCAIFGILSAVSVRIVLARIGVGAFVPAKPLTYSCLAGSATALFWLCLFGN